MIWECLNHSLKYFFKYFSTSPSINFSWYSSIIFPTCLKFSPEKLLQADISSSASSWILPEDDLKKWAKKCHKKYSRTELFRFFASGIVVLPAINCLLLHNLITPVPENHSPCNYALFPHSGPNFKIPT